MTIHPLWALLMGGLLLGAAGAQQAGPAPLTLEAALARLNTAPSVVSAGLSVTAAQQNLAAARSALGLTVAVTGSAAYAGPATATAAGQTTDVPSTLGGSAGVNLSLGLLPWSGAQAGLAQAQRALTLAQARLRDSVAAGRLNVYQTYYAGVAAALDLDLAGRTLALRQRQLAVAQAQQANGNATAEGVLGAQAAAQTAQAGVTQAQGALEAARRSLGAALGTDVGEVAFVSTPPETLAAPDLAGLVAQARASRTEVVSAQNTVADAADALAQRQRDVALPDVTAAVRYGPAGSGGLSASLNLKQGTVGAGYSLPLGDTQGGTSGAAVSDRVSVSVSGSYVVYSPALRAQVSAAQAGVTQAQLALTVAQQNVELDVRTRANTLQTALLGVQTRQTGVEVAQAALDTARARLASGTATADDVSAAELGLAQAQRDLLQARVSAQLALLGLHIAAGGPA